MRVITYVEVYAAKGGQWELVSRGMEKERALALDTARELSTDSGTPTAVIEERLDMETGDVHIEVIFRSQDTPSDIKPPAIESDITSRVFMVVVNAFGLGAVMAVISAALLSSTQSSSSFGLILFIVFGVSALGAGLMLMKHYVPMNLILWRRKSVDARQKTRQALVSSAENPFSDSPPSYKKDVYKTKPRPAAPPKDAEAELDQKSFQVSDSEQEQAEQIKAPEKTIGEQDADEKNAEVEDGDTLAEHREQLSSFAEAAFSSVLESRPEIQSFERFGVNLFIGGAAGALTEHLKLDGKAKLSLLQSALERIGTNTDAAKSFCDRLDASAQRPRFRTLIDAGHAAMLAKLNGRTSRQPPLGELVGQWAERTAHSADEQNVTFLLTDIVGSTALTSKLGNSGAQRIVRAHNTIVRAAINEYKGEEIKHTGDGMLTTFPDPAAAIRAAIEIQQDALVYALDNPKAPLELRVGVHSGSAGYEDGEYFGEAVSLLGGICDAAATGHIACSPAVQSKCIGSVFQFSDMGEVEIKNSPEPIHLFRVEWTPKSRAPKGELEYRQIGTKPSGPE